MKMGDTGESRDNFRNISSSPNFYVTNSKEITSIDMEEKIKRCGSEEGTWGGKR
jgi:hypothetical protein